MGRRGPKPAKHLALAKAALTLFVERGLKDATTRAIAKRAHTTEASLYRHYPGKDALARHVLRTCLQSLEAYTERSQIGAVGARAKLRAYVQAYAQFGREHPYEHSFLQQAHGQNLFARFGEFPRVRRMLSAILAEGQAADEFLPIDARWLAVFLAGGLGRVSQAAWRRGRGGPLDMPAESICDAIESMITSRRVAELALSGQHAQTLATANGESGFLAMAGAERNGREST